MPNDVQTFILHFLNAEPFNKTLTALHFDQLPPNQLLQILSDVLSSIFQIEKFDIRRENPEDTALRILNLLRILRYRPPVETEDLDEWRAGIVEGSKNSVYPLLVFLFENLEALKERAYLANFLMKTEVPSDAHDYDTAELQRQIEELMNEFKETHAELKLIQSDVFLLDDIKEDLISMDREKQLLLRKIEKTEKKVQQIPYFDRHMEVTAQLREEKERIAEYTLQKHQERQKVVNYESRANRMKGLLNELQSSSETVDQTNVVEKLEDEVTTNTYLVNEKLAEEAKRRKAKMSELATMIRTSAISDADIEKMKNKIQEKLASIGKMEEERDNQEEVIDENMSIFRHQVAVLERKKNTSVQKLQNMRQELSKLEKDVEDRKKELQAELGGEILSTVQYKKYLDVFRGRNEEHRRKKIEMNELAAEKTVLKRTVGILTERYEKLKNHIEDLGEQVVEVLLVPKLTDRPKTAAPETNNVNELRTDMQGMLSSLDDKKDKITEKKSKKEELATITLEKSQKLEEIKNQKREKDMELEQRNHRTLEMVTEMEEKIKDFVKEIPEMKQSLSELLEDKNAVQKYSGDEEFIALENQYKIALQLEEELDAKLGTMGTLESIRAQSEYWKSVIAIFKIKIDLHLEKRNN